MSRAYYINRSSLPKTDYTYSRMSQHRQEVIPGVMSLPNMSRPRVGTLGMRNLSSATSSVASSVSSFDTVDYDQFVQMASANSSIQTSVFSRIWTFVSLVISSSVQSIRKYWSESTTSIHELRTPPRFVQQESSLRRLSSWSYNLLSSVYRGTLRVMMLDTWLLSQLRSGRSRPPPLVTLWPLLLLLLLVAGWSLNEGQLVPSFLSAPLGSMISGVQSLTESTVTVLTTLPFGGVQRVIIDILLAPWNVLVALLTFLSSLGSLVVSSISLISVTGFQEPSATFAPLPPQLENAEKSGMSQSYVDALSATLLTLQGEISRLRKDVDDLKSSRKPSEVGAADLNKLKELVIEKEESLLKVIAGAQQQLQGKIDVVGEQLRLKAEEGAAERNRDRILLDSLRVQMDRCCGQLSSTQLKEDIRVEMMHILHTLSPSAYDDADLRTWVRSVFLSRDDLDAALANITANFNAELKRRESIILQSSEAEISARIAKFEYEHRHEHLAGFGSHWRNNGSVAGGGGGGGGGGAEEWQIRRIVENILAVYDADKTGMSDFALESQGGEVISTRCTETYQRTAPSLSLLGIPLWHPSNSPRTVIQPGMHPGDCWAFAGSQGFLVVRLSHVIHVKGFSYEHVPAALLPTGQIDSAPRNFTVYGLKEEIDKEPVFLGSYEYKENGTSLQYFPVQTSDAPPLQHIELHITSNHGNINYTCLYRFRVHGKIA